MAIFAIVGIFTTLALVTVNWTPWSRHVAIVILVLTIVALIASALIALFAGARATHPRSPQRSSDE